MNLHIIGQNVKKDMDNHKKTQESRMGFRRFPILGIILAGIPLVLVIIGFFWTPYVPTEMNAYLKNSAPSLRHLLGTDYMGRDILSRIMVGGRTTFLIAILSVFFGVGIGVGIGAVTGYYGGIVDEVLMRLNDGLTSFPSILLVLVFVGVFGAGKINIVIALSVICIPSFARVVRSEYVVQKELDYVKNAKLMGASDVRIIFVHILPNIRRNLMSAIIIGFNNVILAEAGMSYLSLGVQPPDASLGRMLAEAQTYVYLAPWFVLAPGVMIIMMILGVNLIKSHVPTG